MSHVEQRVRDFQFYHKGGGRYRVYWDGRLLGEICSVTPVAKAINPGGWLARGCPFDSMNDAAQFLFEEGMGK